MLLGYVIEGGNSVFFILDNGIQKRVTIYENNEEWLWQDTRCQLDSDAYLPESVKIGKEHYETEHPDVKCIEIYYIEYLDGASFGLTFGDEFYNTTIYATAE